MELAEDEEEEDVSFEEESGLYMLELKDTWSILLIEWAWVGKTWMDSLGWRYKQLLGVWIGNGCMNLISQYTLE